MSLVQAITTLYPDAHWEIEDEDYDKLVWKSEDIPKPSRTVLETEAARIQAVWVQNQYQRDRKYEYPQVTELADAIYHQQNGNEVPLQQYLAKVQAVKDRFPKP
jgi:hypothetical protein